MSIPVQLSGKGYFVSEFTGKDLSKFRTFVQAEKRKAGYAAIPKGLLDNEFQRYVEAIEVECNKVGPFESIALVGQYEGGDALLMHAALSKENRNVDLSFCADILKRAGDGDEAAGADLEAFAAAFSALVASKKKSQPPVPKSRTAKKKPSTLK